MDGDDVTMMVCFRHTHWHTPRITVSTRVDNDDTTWQPGRDQCHNTTT